MLKQGLGCDNASGSIANTAIDDNIHQANKKWTTEKDAFVFASKSSALLYEDSAIVPLYWQFSYLGSKDNVKIQDVVNDQNYPHLGGIVHEGKWILRR